MLRATKEWDIRCPRALTNQFPERTGYYYKVTRLQARRIVAALSRAYGVPVPLVAPTGPGDCNGCYYGLPRGQGRIHVHARGHIKTVFHEWYHHLDHTTGGAYNSSDRQGGPSSLAWQFADRLFEVFRHQKANVK